MSDAPREPSPKLWLLLLAAVLFSPLLIIVVAIAITRVPGPAVPEAADAMTAAPLAPVDPVDAAWATCVACHGAQGEGMATLGGPALAGQEAWYLRRQLDAFRAGWRGAHPEDVYGQQMAPMATALDEAVIDPLIERIVALPPPATLDPVAGGDADKGAIGYGVCAACHGFEGEGNEALGGPSMLNQHGWYLERQLANYQAGIRGTHSEDVWGRSMAPMADTLPDAQAIKDVVAYIQSMNEPTE